MAWLRSANAVYHPLVENVNPVPAPSSALTLAQLQCFVGVVDSGSFAAAGRQLGLTTSGVSKTITRLESLRGVRLLNRSTHSLSLTDEGEHLIELAREALQSIERVENALGIANAGSTGRVRISAPTAFVAACLAPLLPKFRASHPEILLEICASDAMSDLADEAMDLVLRTGPVVNLPGHLMQRLFSFRWVACASPDYLARRGEPLMADDLANHDLIAFRNQRTGLIEPWRLPAPGSPGTLTRRVPSPSVVLDDANAVSAAALAGAGLIWPPEWLVKEALRSGRLVAVLADQGEDRMPMSIIRRDQPHKPQRLERVIAFLRENCSEHLN